MKRRVCWNIWLKLFRNLQVVNEKTSILLLPFTAVTTTAEAYWGFQFAALYFKQAEWFTQPRFTETAMRGVGGDVHSPCDKEGNVYECIKRGR